MKRFAALFMLVGWLAAGPAHALQLLDDRGVIVTLAQTPQRIVSLLPSLTETVCELGQCPRLVGVDRYSNFPEIVRALPQVGGGLDPNIEAIVALKPDVVLMATSSRAAGRVTHQGDCSDAATHRALEQVFDHRIGVHQLAGQWVALPKI